MRRAGLSGACTCQRTLSAVIVAVLVISSCILLPVIPEPAGAAFSPPRTPNLFLQREGAKKSEKEGGGRESEGGTLLQRASARKARERKEEQVYRSSIAPGVRCSSSRSARACRFSCFGSSEFSSNFRQSVGLMVLRDCDYRIKKINLYNVEQQLAWKRDCCTFS